MKSLVLKTLLFCSIFLFSFSKPLTVNIPINHGGAGVLNPPPTLDPGTIENIWNLVNNSDCDLDIILWFTINNDQSNNKSINLTLTSGSSTTITSSQLISLFGLGGTASLTHSSMNIIKSGTGLQIGEGYPGDDGRKEDNSIEGDCNCIHLDWNPTTRTIVFSNC
jgi:hypothetical protein